MFAANLGCIEIHPFFSRIQKLQAPDFIVFDLDPKKASFQAVIQVAQEIHKVLEEIEVPSYCKTSGKVYIDCFQNNFGQSLAAPYSIRALPGVPVSTPLKWSEVKKGLDPKNYKIKTIFLRLKKMGRSLCSSFQ